MFSCKKTVFLVQIHVNVAPSS